MKKNLVLLFTIAIAFVYGYYSIQAQITIKLPGLTKTGKPTSGKSKVDNPATDVTTNGKTQGESKASGDKLIYDPQRPTATPVLLKNSVYVQAKTHNEYWKMAGQRNYSSWVPMLRFSHFYNNEKNLNYTVEYFNPDGSAWYSEKLEQSSRIAADRTVLFESPQSLWRRS